MTFGMFKWLAVDSKKKYTEMLMKEFKSVHSRMFGNKQAINSSGDSPNSEQTPLKTRSNFTNEQQQQVARHKMPQQSDQNNVGGQKTTRTNNHRDNDNDYNETIEADDNGDNICYENNNNNNNLKLHSKSSGKLLQNGQTKFPKQTKTTTFSGRNLDGQQINRKNLPIVS